MKQYLDLLRHIMDTGVDGSHPDLAANFDAARSRLESRR